MSGYSSVHHGEWCMRDYKSIESRSIPASAKIRLLDALWRPTLKEIAGGARY